MSQEDILTLAKQGNENAIAVLINRSLNSEGVFAKVRKKDDLLQVLLESNGIPDQDRMMKVIQSGILKLEIANISTLEVFGRKTGEKSAVWGKKVILTSPKIPAVSSIQSKKQVIVSTKLAEASGLKRQVPNWIVIALGSVFAIGFLGFARSQSNSSDWSSVVSTPSQSKSVALVKISDLAGKTPEQVSAILGSPTQTETVNPSRTPCPCTLHYYRGGVVEIVFMNGTADWISVNLPASQVDASGSYLSVQQFENPTYTYVKVKTD